MLRNLWVDRSEILPPLILGNLEFGLSINFLWSTPGNLHSRGIIFLMCTCTLLVSECQMKICGFSSCVTYLEMCVTVHLCLENWFPPFCFVQLFVVFPFSLFFVSWKKYWINILSFRSRSRSSSSSRSRTHSSSQDRAGSRRSNSRWIRWHALLLGECVCHSRGSENFPVLSLFGPACQFEGF